MRNKNRIAEIAAEAGLSPDATRASLIDWLRWNDRNGEYTDADARANGWRPLSKSEAWALIAEQTDGGSLETGSADLLLKGQRVKLLDNEERYPHAFVLRGEEGTVTEVAETHVYITLDTTYDGLTEWDNELHFYEEDRDHDEREEAQSMSVAEYVATYRVLPINNAA